MATFNTQQKSYTELSYENKRRYAAKHNYKFQFDTEISDRAKRHNHPAWHKYVMMEQLIETQEYDWIWVLDFDTLITNSSVTIESIVEEALLDVEKPDDVDFILMHDCNRLNCGSMFARARESTARLIDEIIQFGLENMEYTEQDALREIMGPRNLVMESLSGVPSRGEYTMPLQKYNTRKPVIAIIPQWKANAFPREIKCLDKSQRAWEHGMFMVHFAGAWAHIKEDDAYGWFMRKYESEVI